MKIRKGDSIVRLFMLSGLVVAFCLIGSTPFETSGSTLPLPAVDVSPIATPMPTSHTAFPALEPVSHQRLSRVIRVPQDFTSIRAALASAYPGDTVQVSPGTYRENNVTVRSQVTLVGSGWANTIIDGGGSGVVVYGQPNSEIRGFTIRGSGSGTFDAGVWVSEGTVRISDSRLTGNAAGVWAWCFDAATCNIRVTLENNIVDHNTSNGVNSNEAAVFTLRHNTIAHNGGCGVILNNPASLAENNLITNNASSGLANNAAATVRYNAVWGNGRDYSGGGPGPGDLPVNPLYRDAANGDYHLKAASPVIGYGTPAGSDMGALPFTPVGVPPTSVNLSQLSGAWQISWAATGAPGYYVYYGPCTRQTTTVVHVQGATSYRVSGVSAEDMGYVAVSAHDANMQESAVRLADGVRAPCPTAPLNLEVGAFPNGRLRLQWQDTSSFETGFVIERAVGYLSSTTHADFTAIATVPANTTVFTDTPPTFGDTYWYRVRAAGINSSSPYSNESFNASFAWAPNPDEQYLLVLVNEARSAPGAFGYPTIAPMPPLAYSPLLNYAAHAHSQAILNSGFLFGHCDPIGRCPTELAHAVGYTGGVAENLIQGMTGPEWVRSSHQAFMDSEGHRNNILARDFNEAGMGHTYDPSRGGASYWKGQYTEMFSGRPGVVIPNLPSGVVIPYTGVPDTQFTFIVNYYDANGRPPGQPYVYIDGFPRVMNLSTGAAANGTYRYTTTLPAGHHEYYFSFTFSGGSARLPVAGTYAVDVGVAPPRTYTSFVRLPIILNDFN